MCLTCWQFISYPIPVKCWFHRAGLAPACGSTMRTKASTEYPRLPVEPAHLAPRARPWPGWPGACFERGCWMLENRAAMLEIIGDIHGL